MPMSLHEKKIHKSLNIYPKKDRQDRSEWYRIRKAVLKPELYMQADGRWGSWKTAKLFRTTDDAQRFAEQHTDHAYGLFNYEN